MAALFSPGIQNKNIFEKLPLTWLSLLLVFEIYFNGKPNKWKLTGNFRSSNNKSFHFEGFCTLLTNRL